jgi:hypothetical protein
MNLRYASPLSLFAALAISIGACGDDPPTGNNNLDPTLPTNPCDSAMSPAVAQNGFVMSGTGYQGQLVRFDVAPDVQFDFTEFDAAVIYSIDDTVALKDDPFARVTLDIHIPSTKTGTYPFNTLVGDSASYVRLELRRNGLPTKVFRSLEGRIQLDSLVGGAQPYGRFCGILQDSVSRSQIGIMGGRLSPAQ